MPTKNDFAQNHSLPSSLSKRAVRPEQLPFVATRHDTTFTSSLAGILIGALLGIATAIGTLMVWDPVIFAEIKSSLPEVPALQIVFDQSKPATQSTSAAASLLQTTANEAPQARNDIAKAPEANQTQADTHQPLNEDLFRQFQAWAAEQEKRAKVEPVVKLVEEAPPKLEIMKPPPQDVSRVRNTRAEVRPKKRRQVQHGRMLYQPAGT